MGSVEALRVQVKDLEEQLATAKALLDETDPTLTGRKAYHSTTDIVVNGTSSHISIPAPASTVPSIHNLLLVSDSALPLGSFAYSSGLESFLAHHKPLPPAVTPLALFYGFLRLSLQSFAYTSLPYLLATFRQPSRLLELDNDLDASTPCTVTRRASVAQGRALLSIWEKAFVVSSSVSRDSMSSKAALVALSEFSASLKTSSISAPSSSSVNGHFAPLFGVVARALGLGLDEAAYVFLLSHAKAVLSASVRASVMGPYMAQAVLAGSEIQSLIRACMERTWNTVPEETGQVIPMVDLWVGRHELLYSRIFNS